MNSPLTKEKKKKVKFRIRTAIMVLQGAVRTSLISLSNLYCVLCYKRSHCEKIEEEKGPPYSSGDRLRCVVTKELPPFCSFCSTSI